ncbi:MAG: N-methyl-L-tryptophan oxidase [Elusimicrobia bacterium]|nr:N-methyl-L-tryptophan oxidase [Elusimicrobiota bacterium]
MKTNYDVVIVGGGVAGLSTAYYLMKRGKRVAVLEQYEVGNAFGASGDHGRVFRMTYGKDTFYTDLAVRSLALWKDVQKDAREELYMPIGVLDLAMGPGQYEDQCYQALKGMGLPVSKWSSAETHERYRIFNPRAFKFAVHHPDGGMLWAQRALNAFAHLAQSRGSRVFTKTRVTAVLRNKTDGVYGVRDASGKVYEGASYLFAAGAWTADLLNAYGLPIKPTRQELLYLRPPNNQGRYRPAHCPIFASVAKGFYGFPVHIHGFMKLGDHKKGKPGKPGQGTPEISPGFEKNARLFLRKLIPDLAGFSETEGKVCYYDNTPDDDFILDRLPDSPNAWVAAGFSGHGFKFGSLVGKTLADLLVDGKTELNQQRFRLTRFKLKEK